jgi:glutamate racemase
MPLLDAGADMIVLGCTHYPFLSDTIKKVAAKAYPERDIEVIDPAPAVARHLMEVMAEEGISIGDGFSMELNASGDPTTLLETYDRL